MAGVRHEIKTMHAFIHAAKSLALLACAFVLTVLVGCQTAPQASALPEGTDMPDTNIVLHEGDNVKITFPSTPKLDAMQLIRRDGKIVLPVFGEVQAAGLTPKELEKFILDTYGKDLVTKEVTVTLESSQFPVYLNGAVGHPGKIESARPLTVLQAIMEAGGPNTATANLKTVKVIRTEGSEVKTYQLDLRGILKGQPSKPFYLKPYDIVYVPEKFTLF
jgi:polysaccharide export outer membrane protein